MELKIRQERIARGWTLDFVAKQVGAARSTIQMLETGQRKPSYDVLIKLLDLFEYSDPRKLFDTANSTDTGKTVSQ